MCNGIKKAKFWKNVLSLGAHEFEPMNLTMLEPSIDRNSETQHQSVWVGMITLLSLVSHIDTKQSQASMRSSMRKRVDNTFILVCYTGL